MNLVPYEGRGFSPDAVIGAWLQAVSLRRSQSPRTLEAYKSTILNFRESLTGYHKDVLDPDIYLLADYAQIFASTRIERPTNRKGPIAASTIAQRLAILSSFYSYAVKRGHYKANPIDLLERPAVKAYQQSRAIPQHELAERIAQIDTESIQGLRDIAILLVLCSTGRRASEVLAMTREAMYRDRDMDITVRFKTKGGGDIQDKLTGEVALYVNMWLEERYKGFFWKEHYDRPVWTRARTAQRLGYAGLQNICLAILGTSKVHTTRHTFAVLMETANAKLTDIQARLGHANIATTSLYLEKLTGTFNEYSEELTSMIMRYKKK